MLTDSTINLTLLGSAVSTLMFFMLDIPVLFAPEDPFCNIQSNIKNVSFGLTIFLAYFVLWFRIYTVFYSNEIMKNDLSKIVLFGNLSIMPLLLVADVIIVTLFSIEPKSTYAGCGCKPLLSRETYVTHWFGVVASTTVFQIILLVCFLYPLYLHQKKTFNIRNSFDFTTVIPVIKRTAIAAGAWIISSVFNLIFAVVYSGTTAYWEHLVYSINLLVTLNATLLSFSNWRVKLFPFRKTSITNQHKTKHSNA